MKVTLAALAVGLFSIADVGQTGDREAVIWTLDNLSRIGGHPVTLIGQPLVVKTGIGPAVQFNGRTDGLLLDRNPLAGLARFTIEVLFSPDADGPEEQRFLHLEEHATGNRALVELRMAAGRWSLDSYLRSGDAQLTLLDRAQTHAAAVWHVSTLTFDGATMTHYVDGIRQGSGAVVFQPLKEGRTSIGVRQNQVSWFKGRIRTIRISPEALPAARFLPPPAREQPGDQLIQTARIWFTISSLIPNDRAR